MTIGKVNHIINFTEFEISILIKMGFYRIHILLSLWLVASMIGQGQVECQKNRLIPGFRTKRAYEPGLYNLFCHKFVTIWNNFVTILCDGL